MTTTPVPTPAPPPSIDLDLNGVRLYPELASLAAQILAAGNGTVNNSAFASEFSCVTRRYNESCVIDPNADLGNILWLGLPALLFLAAGLVYVSRHTSEDGFVVGPRMIDAPEPWPVRRLSTAMTYVLEGTQLAGLAFGPATVRSIDAGPAVQAFLTAFFFGGGHWPTTFIAVTAIYGMMTLFMLWPMVQYWTLDQTEFEVFETSFVYGNFGRHMGVIQDIYMLYMTIPAFIGMLIMAPCEYYETGEPSTAMFRTAECTSTEHEAYAIAGGILALFALIVGCLAGTVPIMTMRKDKHMNLNGRFLSLNFMIKACLAVTWVLFRENHEWIHLICVLIGQVWLLYLNVGLRPCLVEVVNFHRSAALCLSLVPTIALLISSGLADKLNALPSSAGGVMAGLMFVMLLLKYFVFPCGKLFPAIPYQPPPPRLPLRYLGYKDEKGKMADGIPKTEEELEQEANAAAIREAERGGEGGAPGPRRRATGDAGAVRSTTATDQEEGEEEEAAAAAGKSGCCGGDDNRSRIVKEAEERLREHEGEYEGGIILGQAVPQGQGMLRWHDQSKVWGGTFLFGSYHGYGVMTNYKYFFQGMHWLGAREGFGVTNQLEGADEDFYEGNWVRGEMSGNGTKQFTNNDTYDGQYHQGVEHGTGVWSFDTALGRHTIKEAFEEGAMAEYHLEENELYEGDMRFGVPHGLGRMEVDGTVLEGEWRAGKLHGNGTVTLATGGTYEGILVEGKFHTDGTWRDEKETYTGKWVHGQKHGTGVQEVAEGKYEGMFVRDVRMGFGTFTYKDGTVYNGSWFNNIYHGAGTLTSSDGSEYEGFFVNGKCHGPRGKVRYPNDESYSGDWDEDEYHGEGVLKLPMMGEYHGRFEFSRREGNGRFSFLDGSEYVGAWSDDVAYGEGKFTFSSRKAIKVLEIMSLDDASKLEKKEGEKKTMLEFGGVYEGEFADGTMNGKGYVKTSDGTEYEGQWVGGFPGGHGTMLKPDGTMYKGDFKDGHQHGKGRTEYPDGRVYVGSFEDGKRHGHGVLYDADPDGEDPAAATVVYDCEWVNDYPEGQGAELKDQVDELRELPPVDIDELMRVIMPSSQTVVDIEQSAMRRRVELEERWHRFATCIWIDEERVWRHTIKQFLTKLEEPERAAIDAEAIHALRKEAKNSFMHILNQWKADYKFNTGKEPKKSDLLKDPFADRIFKIWTDLQK